MDCHYSGTLFKDLKTIKKTQAEVVLKEGGPWSGHHRCIDIKEKVGGGGGGGRGDNRVVILQEEWSLVRVVS